MDSVDGRFVTLTLRADTVLVNDLDAAQYITAGLRDVVDQVRKRGNIANHELPASMKIDALKP